MKPKRVGRIPHGASKKALTAAQSLDEKVSVLKHGALNPHVVQLAAAAQWVAQAGVAAICSIPLAQNDFTHCAAKLGKWAAAWMLHPHGAWVLSQACATREFAQTQGIKLYEHFPADIAGEPTFGNITKFREAMAKRGNVEPERLEIPETVHMTPVHGVAHEIVWRASLLLHVNPSCKFTISEISGWFQYKLNRRTIQKTVKRFGIPTHGTAGRPKGRKDDPKTLRQKIGKM